MKRMEEYKNLMQELDAPAPQTEHTLDRAIKRNARRKRIVRPVTGFTAAFICFVLLVNLCIPVAYACSKIPFLRELTEAVTFSRSLTDALDNQYVQPLHLWQVDNDVTATIEYLIVDQKQVNIFYRLDSEKYTHMSEHPQILDADGSRPSPCTYSPNAWDVPNGDLRSITINFIEENVPNSLRMILDITDEGSWQAEDIVTDNSPEAVPIEDELMNHPEEYMPDYIAHFDFLLEFDPEFTAAGKTIPINRTVTLDGQDIILTDMQIYPTHLRLNISDAPENTAWIRRLDFYIETDWGMKFDPISNGITATGTTDSPMMTSYYADSSYFYEAKHIKIVITGAEWLKKDMERVHLDLNSGNIDSLPEGCTLDRVTRKENGWVLRFLAEQKASNQSHQLFSSIYYDPDGNECSIDSWTTSFTDEGAEGKERYFYETFPLQDYPYDEVWLCPNYSHDWTAEIPIVIDVQ